MVGDLWKVRELWFRSKTGNDMTCKHGDCRKDRESRKQTGKHEETKAY